MRKLLFISLIILCQLSCAEKEIEIPGNVLSKKEMTALLTDIHISQASVGIKSRTDSSGFTMKDYIPVLLKRHNTERGTFIRSLKFYSENPDILQQVYDSVITGLSKIQGEAEK
jgi:hypothetical protein